MTINSNNNVFALLKEKHNQSPLIFMVNVKENSYLWDAPSLESVTLVKSYYFLLKVGNVYRNWLKTLKQTPSPRKWLVSSVHSFAFDISFILIGFTLSLLYLTNKEASTALCSVVKHAGSGRARKKCRGKHETQSSVFPHFLSALPLPKCFTTEQSSVEASLFVLCWRIRQFPQAFPEFSNQIFFSNGVKVASAVY